MSFDVHIQKRVRSGARAFALDVRFQTTARQTVIYGPSGAGKSMALQTMAGLLTQDGGHVVVGGQRLFDAASGIQLPARQRRLGYLFQDYALFPHLNVRQNIAFGLQHGWRNPARAAANDTVAHWLHVMELGEVAGQYPHQLSGGQRQRTALARALANDPVALLLDEPFAALDPALRARMRDELQALLQRVDIPMLMITHDPVDLARFGQARFYLRDGVIVPEPS